MLVTGLVLYAAGTAALYVSDLYVLLGTRALLGVAVGAIMTAIGALITDWFDGPRRARLLGLQQALLPVYAIAFAATLVFFLAPTQLPFLLRDLGVGGA